MNRAELIDHMAEAANITKAAAGLALDAVIDNIVLAAVRDPLGARISGLGTFSSKRRQAGEGTNPRTGEKIKVAAKTVPKFKPSKAFEERLNS